MPTIKRVHGRMRVYACASACAFVCLYVCVRLACVCTYIPDVSHCLPRLAAAAWQWTESTIGDEPVHPHAHVHVCACSYVACTFVGLHCVVARAACVRVCKHGCIHTGWAAVGIPRAEHISTYMRVYQASKTASEMQKIESEQCKRAMLAQQ